MRIPLHFVHVALSVLILISIWQWGQQWDAVAWFSGLAAVATTFAAVQWSKKPERDSSFLDILVWVVCGGSFVIAAGQWYILDNSGPEALFVPLVTVGIWKWREKQTYLSS